MSENELPAAWQRDSNESTANNVERKDFSTLPDLSILGPPEVVRARAYEVVLQILLPKGIVPHKGVLRQIGERLVNRAPSFEFIDAEASSEETPWLYLDGSFVIPDRLPETDALVKKFAFDLNILLDGQIQDFGIQPVPPVDTPPNLTIV